jgi:hypothetical protein
VLERVPVLAASTPDNVRYLEAKRSRFGHLLGAQRSTPEADAPTTRRSG